MEHKLLTGGSILTVVIIVLAGLSPVVGFDSVRSSVKDSPLFNIRTTKAIGEESQVLTCEYVGKGKVCALYIPRRNNQIETVLKVIDLLSKMDDETFERFIASIINHVQEYGKFIYVSPDEIRTALYQVRDSDKPLPVSDTRTENKNHPLTITICSQTCAFYCFTFFAEPFCLIKIFIGIIGAFLLWCFQPAVTGIGCPTLACPHTLQRLF